MASPLKWFRKHEKLLLGFFGVMLMIVFTISFGSGVDPIVDSISGQGVRSSDVLVSFKGGNLDYTELTNLRANRYALRQLMGFIQNHTYQQNKQPQAVMFPVNQTSDQALLELVILNKEADRLGIQITDDSILSYLQQISAGTLQPNEILNVWRQVTQGGGTEKQLLSLLRRELAAQKIRGMAMSGTWSVSPMRGWDYFNKLERYISAEFLPMPVEDFVDQVADPSELELREFYDEFKEDYRIPGSRDPGFKRRLRRAFDLVKFDSNEFLDAEKKRVSDQQVQEYYEANKEKFRETLPSSDLELDEGISTSDAEADSANEEPVQDEEEGAAPTDGASDDVVVPDAPPSDQPDTDTGLDSESDPSFTPVPQEDKQPDEPKPDAESKPAASTQAADPNMKEESTSEDKSEAADAGQQDANQEKTTEAEKPVYRPLEEVSESIKETIAAPTAQKKMKTAISQLQTQMDRYYRRFVTWDMDKKNKDRPQPEQPDIASVESPVPLSVQSMPMSSILECDAYELGQAYDLEFSQQSFRQIPFAQVAYEDNMSLYQPMVFPSGEAPTKYVYWITSQEVPYTPELAEIRDEVVKAWKVREARALAIDAAEELAITARQKKSSLSDSLAAPGRNFFQTGEITWMSTGSVGIASGAMPSPTEIPGVAMAGDDFRETMFRLDEGEVAVSFDAPQTTVYVIRVISKTPTNDQVAQQFFNDDSHATAMQYLEQSNRMKLLQTWYQDLLKKYSVSWKRDPGGIE